MEMILHNPPRRPVLEPANRIEQVRAHRRETVLHRDGTVEQHLPLRDPGILELLEGLREGALADARGETEFVEPFRTRQEGVEDAELELRADHPDREEHGAPGSVARGVPLRHGLCRSLARESSTTLYIVLFSYHVSSQNLVQT